MDSGRTTMKKIGRIDSLTHKTQMSMNTSSTCHHSPSRTDTRAEHLWSMDELEVAFVSVPSIFQTQNLFRKDLILLLHLSLQLFAVIELMKNRIDLFILVQYETEFVSVDPCRCAHRPNKASLVTNSNGRRIVQSIVQQIVVDALVVALRLRSHFRLHQRQISHHPWKKQTNKRTNTRTVSRSSPETVWEMENKM